MLKETINNSVKDAMRAKDKVRLKTLRLITSAIKQREVDERIELDDTQVLAILDKMIKQRKDSIEQYEKAERDDLVQVEKDEIEIISEFMPQPLSEDEVAQMIDDAIATTGASDMKGMGKVMGILKPQLQGRADMGKVSGVIKARLTP